MITLVHGRVTFRDATQGDRIPVKQDEIIEKGTLVSLVNNEVVKATAQSKNLGIAMTSVVGSDKKCSVVYQMLKEGDQIHVDKKEGVTFKAGMFYTIRDEKSIDEGTESAEPIANSLNLLYDGREFTVYSF